MRVGPKPERPLDAALRERLNLRGARGVWLRPVRALLHFADVVSRLLVGGPFVALRETEAVMRGLQGVIGPDFVRAVLARNGGTKIEAHGLENVAASGPVVIVATHPTGVFDFLAHAGALLDRRPDLKVIAYREAETFLGRDMVVQVTLDARNRVVSGEATRTAMVTHLRAGGALLVFGSGRVADRRGGRLVEPEWRRGATIVSKTCNAPVVPASLDARNSDAYYRLRSAARFLSGGNDYLAARVASLRYSADLLEKMGGRFDVYYDTPLPPGTAPGVIRARAEALVPNLYETNSGV